MKKLTSASLSAIAALAITKTVLDYFKFDTNLLAFLLTTLIVGITTFLLPLLVEKVNFAHSIICTGFTVLLMTIFANFQSNLMQEYWLTFILIMLVALCTDILNAIINHNFHFANLIFDAGICLLANHIISLFDNSIVTLIVLVVTYSIVLLVNFSFKFSIKRKSLKEKAGNTENTENIVKKQSKINIPMGKRSSIDVPFE